MFDEERRLDQRAGFIRESQQMERRHMAASGRQCRAVCRSARATGDMQGRWRPKVAGHLATNRTAIQGPPLPFWLWLTRVEATFTRLGSASHLAAAWIERGDLARSVGDLDGAAALYRRSAESLQDFHF